MHMSYRLRRLIARFFAVSLLAATLFTVDSLASPSPAEARCNGQGNPVWSNWYRGGVLTASETPGAGTCNRNNIYTGVLRDDRADGYCVVVQFKETGIDWTDAGAVCERGNTSTFQWEDLNGNSYVYQRFCIFPLSDPTQTTACGWGTGGSYGINHGF
jgi:hypothetical protein